MRCCVDDEGFVALRRRPAGGGVKPSQAALVNDRRGERWGRRRGVIASGGDREGERERTAEDVSKQVDDIGTGAVKWRRDEPGGCPSIGQVVSGMEAARVRCAASTRNVGRRLSMLLSGAKGCEIARGSASRDGNRGSLSTDATRAGGPARSSGEAPVTGVERRGRLIKICLREQPGVSLG
jgi:hypothetical protein